MLIALYIAVALAVAYTVDRFREGARDFDIAGYICGAIMLAALTGVLGPTLDSEPIAKDGRGTAYAARQQ